MTDRQDVKKIHRRISEGKSKVYLYNERKYATVWYEVTSTKITKYSKHTAGEIEGPKEASADAFLIGSRTGEIERVDPEETPFQEAKAVHD